MKSKSPASTDSLSSPRQLHSFKKHFEMRERCQRKRNGVEKEKKINNEDFNRQEILNLKLKYSLLYQCQYYFGTGVVSIGSLKFMSC